MLSGCSLSHLEKYLKEHCYYYGYCYPALWVNRLYINYSYCHIIIDKKKSYSAFLCSLVTCDSIWVRIIFGKIKSEDVPLVELMYLVLTCMPWERYRRWLKSLLLHLCYIFWALIISLMCWFQMSDFSLFMVFLNLHQSSVLILPFGSSMADTTCNCCHLSAGFVYTIQSCTSLQWHFIQSQVHSVPVCFAVTPHLHFRQIDRDCLQLLW